MKQPIIYLLMLMLPAFTACTDADKFYQVLDRQPEVVTNTKTVYAVGDTITIKGRLNPEHDLIVHIGGVACNLFEKSTIKVTYGDIDIVKGIITDEMGVGQDRPVTVTSSGITISIPPVEIVGSALEGVLPQQLQLQKVADIPADATPVYCHSGNGNVYLWNSTTKALSKVTAATGLRTQVFAESNCTDANGTFTITAYNAGAISPDERYFYFSAKVAEAGQSRTVELYKLCRFDLQTNTFITLNRTEYSLVRSRRTLESTQPWEGNVNDVKIYHVSGIYPDAAGNVYCNLLGHFLTILDANGNYKYALDLSVTSSFSTNFIPQINDPATSQYYSEAKIHQTLPGILVTNAFSYLDADAKKMYSIPRGGTQILSIIDIPSGITTAAYTSNFLSMVSQNIPYVTASLNSFNGGLAGNLFPLAFKSKLLGLYFLNQVNTGSGDYDKFYANYELPAFCEIDFDKKQATRYAPKKLVLNGYAISQTDDQLLNYDKDGMVYLTTGSNTAIVKTAVVQ